MKYFILLSALIVSGCATTLKPAMDMTEIDMTLRNYHHCVASWTKKYNGSMEPRDVADAAVGKCEPQLMEFKSALNKQTDHSFSPGSEFWVKSRKMDNDIANSTQSKVIRNSIAYQAEIKIAKQSPSL